MATLTLKNLPPQLHEKLKKKALQNHRSLNSEVISCLEATLGSQKVDVEMFLLRVNKLRSKVGGQLKDRDLIQFKNQGRP